MDTTREHKERMYEEVLKYVAESYRDNPNEITATISTRTLDELTGLKLDENYVIENEEELSKSYKHLSTAYGFENFYDLYNFAMSVDDVEEVVVKGGQKDLSKLKKVKRTVVRNGKQTTMTFYEDPNAEDSETPHPKTQANEKGAPQPTRASDLTGSILGDMDKKITVKELKAITKVANEIGKPLDTTCSNFILLADEEHKALLGFKKKGDYIVLSFTASDDLTTGVEERGYFELVKLALSKQLGAIMENPESPLVIALLEADGFTKENKDYKIEGKKLIKVYGELT